MKTRILLFCLALFPSVFFAQIPDITNWVKRLNDRSPTQCITRYHVYREIQKLDPAATVLVADAIAKACQAGDQRLQIIGRSVKSKFLFYNTQPRDSIYAAELKICLNEATELDEPYLQAEFGRLYSEMLNSLNQKELAVQYAITSLKLQEYLGFENFPAVSIFYMWVGESLLITDYTTEAIQYLQKGLQLASNDTLVRPFRFMFTYNNLGLAYRDLHQHDSALFYFKTLHDYCVKKKELNWQEIAYKNGLPSLVALQMLDSAKVVVHHLFEIAKTSKEPDDELIAWEMTGRIAMLENDFTKAEQALLKSAALNNGRNMELLNRVHEGLAACYEKMGNGKEAYRYLKLASTYNDSISEVKASRNNRYLFIKAEYDKEQMRLSDLAEEKKKAIRNRNIGILSLLLLACALILYMNQRKNKATQLQQQATKELERFKEEILAKNDRIEQLLMDAGHRQQVVQDAHAAEELSQQMILTEADWQNFKSLFEKTYPAFFRKLRDKAPGITEAEQRMAALVKIQLTTRQIASMQGIGTDSVHKTRHRLRQRFGTETTAELETLIDEI